MPRCYSRTLELDIVLADHEAFTKQKDSGELIDILIKKLKSNEYLMYGGSENDELEKVYKLIRFRHYKQVLEGIEELIIMIHECVTIMEWRGIAHDWRLSCKEIMVKNEAEIKSLNDMYNKNETTKSVMHVFNAISNYLIFDKYSELVSQTNKEVAIRLLLKISKHIYTRNISYTSTIESELFRFADNLIEID
jgi:sulfur relay (sulfurtransferase) complex TusBCD TusD component (DsrE family)